MTVVGISEPQLAVGPGLEKLSCGESSQACQGQEVSTEIPNGNETIMPVSQPA
jgi:hypothetical protein